MMSFSGQTVFIGGGSKGLGLELAKQLIKAHASHIVLFARNQEELHKAKHTLEENAQKDQTIETWAADLSDPVQVNDAFHAFPIPDCLFCVAGGAKAELGFLIERDPEHIRSCVHMNYYTAVFMAQVMLRIWVDAPPTRSQDGRPKERHILFTSSIAAFVGLPGYIAYTPTKCAVRALADTLRSEVLRYNIPAVTYKIHCAFPGTFVTPSFIEEQRHKPELTKRLEGTDKPEGEILKKTPPPAEVARRFLEGLRRDEFAIWYDFECALLLNNMMGPTPRRGFGAVDFLLAVIAWIIFPLMRAQQDAYCQLDRETR